MPPFTSPPHALSSRATRRIPLRAVRAAALSFAVAFAASAHAAPPDILPFAEVRPGMRGTGLTVFSGTEVTSFDVEIVGTLPGIGPDQNLILGRCTGGPLEDTRILSGMSGSPVFVDGKLVGAVAYSWGFSKAPIAGITPAEEMMRIGAGAGTRASNGSPAFGAGAGGLAGDPRLLGRPDRIPAFFANRLEELAAVRSTSSATIPIGVSGLGARGLAAIAPELARAGFAATQAGASGSIPGKAPPLRGGSPVGVKLVRGDVEFTATGTVTWVDGDRVYAFGHPLFGLGEVDLPMTAARVETLMSNWMQSSRLASAWTEVGALHQDRVSGIAGTLGAKADMIPVRLAYSDGAGGRATYAFDVAADPMLAPLLVYYAVNGVVASRDRAIGNATVRVAPGSVIRLADREDVALDNLFSGASAVPYATGTAAYILHLLLNNDWSPPVVEGVNLLLEYDNAPRTARVQRATLDRYRVTAGETVRASVVLRPYRGREQVVRREILIPPETPPGKLDVLIGGALAVSRPQAGEDVLLPHDLDQLVWLINNLRRNDHVFVVATREDDGFFLAGARLPNLPPSAATILTRPARRGNVTVVSRRGVLEETIETEFAVEGITRLELEVVSP